MARIKIEDYRDFEISFDTENETFYTLSERHDSDKTKNSYSSIKKFIDEFIKDNVEFKPFNIEGIPDASFGRTGRVIGIRKDGRFIYIPKGSEKPIQLSEYDEKSTMIHDPENIPFWEELEKIKIERDALRTKEKEINSKFKIKNLKDYKTENFQ